MKVLMDKTKISDLPKVLNNLFFENLPVSQ